MPTISCNSCRFCNHSSGVCAVTIVVLCATPLDGRRRRPITYSNDKAAVWASSSVGRPSNRYVTAPLAQISVGAANRAVSVRSTPSRPTYVTGCGPGSQIPESGPMPTHCALRRGLEEGQCHRAVELVEAHRTAAVGQRHHPGRALVVGIGQQHLFGHPERGRRPYRKQRRTAGLVQRGRAQRRDRAGTRRQATGAGLAAHLDPGHPQQPADGVDHRRPGRRDRGHQCTRSRPPPRRSTSACDAVPRAAGSGGPGPRCADRPAPVRPSRRRASRNSAARSSSWWSGIGHLPRAETDAQSLRAPVTSAT